MGASTSDQVASIKAQFKALQEELQSASGKTKGVVGTINKMINMVESEIEPAIKQAHNDDQEVLNTKMNDVKVRNGGFIEEEKELQQDANDVRDLIDKEQAASKTWEDQSKTFTGAQTDYLAKFGQQTDTCCQRDNAAVMDIQTVPAYAECDYKDQANSGGCAARAKEDVSNAVKGTFSSGLKKYRELRTSCNTATTELNTADTKTQQAFHKCGSDKRAAQAAAKLAASEQKRVQKRWDTATSKYSREYDSLMNKYNGEKAKVKKNEKDRKAETEAIAEIKCMLLKYKKSHVFDDSTHQSCKDAYTYTGEVDIGYPDVIKKIVPKLKEFEKQTDDSAYESTCNTRADSPAFSCPVKKPNPVPVCKKNPQPAAPAHKFHKGPWNGEVEAKCWKLKAGQRSPGVRGPKSAATDCTTYTWKKIAPKACSSSCHSKAYTSTGGHECYADGVKYSKSGHVSHWRKRVSDSKCGKKPAAPTQHCRAGRKCYAWKKINPPACRSSCHSSAYTSTGSVQCRKDGSHVVSNSYCNRHVGGKPSAPTKHCRAGKKCYSWVRSNPPRCSSHCGSHAYWAHGQVYCRNHHGHTVSNSYCNRHAGGKPSNKSNYCHAGPSKSWRIIKHNHECDVNHNEHKLGVASSWHQCAQMCQNDHKCRSHGTFIYGKGWKRGHCWSEGISPHGCHRWERDKYDFYGYTC